MNSLFTSAPFILTIIVGSYMIGNILYIKSKIALLHPILISIATVVGVLLWLKIPYETFYKESFIIHFMLGPSVVALGYTLYEQSEQLKGRIISILTSVLVGSFVSIISVVTICKAMNVSPDVIASLQPKSVTTPIALILSEQNGGITSLTGIAVIVCGIFGSIVAPIVLRIFRIKSPIAQGLAMGSAAHGLGTARAIEIGAVQGAFSGLAIGLMGLITSLLIPLISYFI